MFGGLQLRVDDPPHWYKDYLSGIDVPTRRSARQLNHRELPHGADIKLIWELSRWNQLVRLAQAAYVLNDERAGHKCVEWLKDWTKQNPPFRGWNWTSALESGLRLIQFCWIDALLCRATALAADLELLRNAILPAHVQFTWHCRTFGSSANNHLLGELAGLIVAIVRWPSLQKCAAGLDRLQAAWEKEVLAQFWSDGGNKEQALNYQLFSWELCWVARLALVAAKRPVDSAVDQRLAQAARFHADVQAVSEPWDYGDSDNACVTPLFTTERNALKEWRDWIDGESHETGYGFWLGAAPNRSKTSGPVAAGEWSIYQQSGIGTCRSGDWSLRWDLSPLGYLKPAAHGHLDALHLSIWQRDVALIIDPGTGAYYGDPALRNWLASRGAHNGPCVEFPDQPKRLGPFLWSHHHPPPQWHSSGTSLEAELSLSGALVKRRVRRSETGDGWQITDAIESHDSPVRNFSVRWQFAPGAFVKVLSERRFQITRRDACVIVDVDISWADVILVERETDRPETEPPLAGVVSSSFRKTAFAPYLRLMARLDDKPCVFRTTFLACEVR